MQKTFAQSHRAHINVGLVFRLGIKICVDDVLTSLDLDFLKMHWSFLAYTQIFWAGAHYICQLLSNTFELP